MTRQPLAEPVSGLAVLMDMLTFRRPAWSSSEDAFIARFLHPLDGLQQDDFGNLSLTIPEPDGSAPRILWSSHTDTVHRTPGRQAVVRQGAMVLLRDTAEGRKGASNCLGADCAAGVWLMREMILAAVPGLYIFHRDEEAGGKGSTWIAANEPERLSGIAFAIAFDRKGYGDVITHQGDRTASEAFARSLAAILGGDFRPDDTGLFTDTAMYAGLVGECSNLSVGYFDAHGPRERQDAAFLVTLRDTLVAADWSGLVASRAAGEASAFTSAPPWGWDDHEGSGDPFGALVAFVRSEPELVADFLADCGVSLADLEAHAGYFRFN